MPHVVRKEVIPCALGTEAALLPHIKRKKGRDSERPTVLDLAVVWLTIKRFFKKTLDWVWWVGFCLVYLPGWSS